MMPRQVDRLLDLAVRIQQVPAPPFGEAQRAEFVHSLFSKEGLDDVSIDSLNNVYGRIRGQGRAAPLIVSAHLDTVFPLETDLSIRREADRIIGPGIGDNSLGVAALFGLLWALRERSFEPAGDIWLVGNVGEEGLGDLRGMRAVVDRFGSDVQAYLVLEGMALGYVYHRALGVQRYRITMHTPGGHSWSEYGQPSAIHELAALVTQLTGLSLPSTPRTTLNVGTISGGVAVNVLAPEASLELDLRSEDPQTLSWLVQTVESMAAAAGRDPVEVELQIIGQRPAGAILESHPLVMLAQGCLRSVGISPGLAIGSTDANIPLSRGLPAVCVGISTGWGAHTTGEYIQTSPVEKGLAQLVSLVSQVWDI
jgi:tripeptide aminopeptidase